MNSRNIEEDYDDGDVYDHDHDRICKKIGEWSGILYIIWIWYLLAIKIITEF